MNKYLTLLLILPSVGLAQDGLKGIFSSFVRLADFTVGLIIAAATLVFVWGVLQYVISADNESKKSEAKGYMTYGVITLFVMVSIWGLTRLLSGSFGLEESLNLPDVKSSVDKYIVLLDRN
jgi:Na+/H+ antiporter NhaC